MVDFDRGEIIKYPGLADRKGSVEILACLVDPNSTRFSHGDNYVPSLLKFYTGSGRRGRRWVHPVFYD